MGPPPVLLAEPGAEDEAAAPGRRLVGYSPPGMAARTHIGTAQRRARLVARHHLLRTASSVEAAVRSLVAVHSTDPITAPLALRARVPEFTVDELERALYRDRSLWRLHAMRRTLFVVHVDDAPVVLAACSRDVERTERRKLERWVADARDGADASRWLQQVEAATLSALGDGRARRTAELGGLVEGLSLPLTVGSGRWSATVPLSTRLLFLLALDARIVRAEPAGSWISSQYRWVQRAAWFGDAVTDDDLRLEPATARARLAHGYLRAHGPASRTDLRWWTGWSARSSDAALAANGAVEVDLDEGGTGWVLPDDLDPVGGAVGGVGLLPTLDPTVMGWKERDWYLGAHAGRLFDSSGNAGPTIWLDGRVVGGWGLSPAGEVVTRLLEDVGSAHAAAVEAEAAALTEWLAGVAPTPRFRTPLERALSAPDQRAPGSVGERT